MDYLETDPLIDSQKVAVAGHSRRGKAALWAAAQDQRFVMVISNNSGCTGAAVARGKHGETIRLINEQFPHWFNGNYKSYNDREYELPVDQHMLLALIAPRLLYISSATEDVWSDPQSEFLSAILAGEAYHLFGYKGLDKRAFPQAEQLLYGDRIAYHLRTGEHDLTEYDWNCFMDFADHYLK
jgi:hypothetical protein